MYGGYLDYQQSRYLVENVNRFSRGFPLGVVRGRHGWCYLYYLITRQIWYWEFGR